MQKFSNGLTTSNPTNLNSTSLRHTTSRTRRVKLLGGDNSAIKPMQITSKSRARGVKGVLLVASVVSAGLFSGAAYATDCKGQSETQCATSESCSWVESYTRKDNRKVNGFCRAKSKGNKAAFSKSKPNTAKQE